MVPPRALCVCARGEQDKQHLVDIFRRHMDSDWASDNDDDHPGANTRDFVVTYDESERSQQPGQAPPTVHMYSQPPEPRLPLGGGPSESGRIPSFTISRARSSGNDADNARASDLHVEDIVSGADSRVVRMVEGVGWGGVAGRGLTGVSLRVCACVAPCCAGRL